MRVLVTGAAGFIGSHTAVALMQAGHTVVGVDDFSEGRRSAQDRISTVAGAPIVIHDLDLRDGSGVDALLRDGDFGAIIHLAGRKFVGESVRDPLRYFDCNLATSLTVFTAAQAHGVRRIVFSSSCTVYGDPSSAPVTEDHPLDPVNPYGFTKLMIEQLLADMCASDPELSVMALRYFNPIGAHPSGLLGEYVDGTPNNLLPYVMKVASGELPRMTVFGDDYDTPDGTCLRDYVHVVDIARGHVQALEQLDDRTGFLALNLGTGVGRSVLEIIEACRKATGREIPYRVEPRRDGDAIATYADPQRAEQVLGWTAGHTLEQMCEDHWRFTVASKNHVEPVETVETVERFPNHDLEPNTNAESVTQESRNHVQRLFGHASAKQSLVTVSGDLSDEYDHSYANGERPKADYVAIAEAAGADLLDRREVRTRGSSLTRLAGRIAGPDVAMALHIFRNRRYYDVVLTDGEHIGLPLAALLRFMPGASMRHIMIGHRISNPKKRALVKLLKLSRGIDEILVYATSQFRAAKELFGGEGPRVTHIDFMVDCDFFKPQPEEDPVTSERPLIVTAGREFRDYPTLIEAVAGLDVDVIVASASPWSKREDNAHDVPIPDNVTITKLTQRELRDAFDRATLAVVPLQAVDFQAGITTILEAMSMGLPVVCTATVGQIDMVIDGVTGWYVGPGDVGAMRAAITSMLEDEDLRQEFGKAGRRLVEERATLPFYANTIADRLGTHRTNDTPRKTTELRSKIAGFVNAGTAA